MKNFINSRVQGHNNIKIFNAIKHNLRHTQRSLSQIENNNFNYIFLDGKPTKITKENKKELYTKISSEYKKDRSEHNEIYKKHNKRNLRESCGSWGEGVFTFSEQMKQDINNKKYTFDELSKIALECLKDYEKHLGIKTKFMVLHLDEKTPHFQYFFTNFDDNGASITHLNKTTDRLSQLQDIAHKHFGKLGMERGLKKDFTNNSHMSAAKYWQTQGAKIKDKTISLEEQYNNKKIEIEKDLKSLYTEVNLKKNEVKDLRANYDKTSQEYKDLTIVYKQLQEEEKLLREKVRELKEIDNLDNYLIDLKKDIKNIFEKHTKEVDPWNYKKHIEVENRREFFNNIIQKIKEPLNVQIKEVDILKEENKALKIDLKQKEDQNNTILEKLNLERNKTKVLEQENGKILKQSKNVIETMDKQQKAFQRQIRANTRLRNQRQRLFQKIMRDNNLTRAMQTRKYLKTTPTKTIKKDNLDKNINFDR